MKTPGNQLKELTAATGNTTKLFLALIEEDGTVQFINSHLVNVLNLTSENIQSINFFSFLQAADLEVFKHLLSVTKKGNSRTSASFPLKNGNVHYMKWEITNLVSIDKFLCVGYEQSSLLTNTGMEAASGELQEENTDWTEAGFKAYIDNLPRFAWVMNEKKKIVYSNKSLLAHYDTDLENLQKKITSLLSKPVLRALTTNREIAIRNRSAYTTILTSPRADGSEYVFRITTFPIGDSGLTGGEAENITASWEKEQELKSVNERLLYITQASTEATWEWDMATGHILRNAASQEMIGFLPEDTSRFDWWLSRIHPADRKKLEEKITHVLSNHLQSWEQEYRFLCADKKYITLYDKGFVIYENAMPVKMIGSLQDITEVKKLELQLMKEKLDKQEKIAEAIIEAQESERTKLGLELHDNVNQVLTTAKLYLEMIKSVNERDRIILDKSKEFIQQTINEIRNVSKEMVLPQLKENSLVESIRELLDEIELTGFYDIDFSYNGNMAMEITEGKKVTLFRIMQEQLKNIIKHSRAKKITVQLQFTAGAVIMAVEDNGIGFDATKKRRGIGLSNIYDRAELYKGKVEIKTAPGKGCRLEIKIPI